MLETAEKHLQSTIECERAGWGPRLRALKVAAGSLVRVRPGWFVDGDWWMSVRPEQQHLAAIAAAARESREPLTFTHRSAATLLGLPVWSDWLTDRTAPDPRLVHVGVRPSAFRGSTAVVRRHPVESLHMISRTAGYTHRDLLTTLCDVARSEVLPVALAVADVAMRRSIGASRKVDVERYAEWRAEVRRLLEAQAGGRGEVMARAVTALADPRAESPLESGSRCRLLQLGIVPELQVEIPGEFGRPYWLDFVLPGTGCFGESDGASKYLDRIHRGRMTADEAVLAEKRRSNWAEGVTGMRGVRWGPRHVRTLQGFAKRLQSFGVPFAGVPTTAFGRDAERALLQSP